MSQASLVMDVFMVMYENMNSFFKVTANIPESDP